MIHNGHGVYTTKRCCEPGPGRMNSILQASRETSTPHVRIKQAFVVCKVQHYMHRGQGGGRAAVAGARRDLALEAIRASQGQAVA